MNFLNRALVALYNVNLASPLQPASVIQIVWYKRFLDNDTRYTQFLTPRVDPSIVIFKLDTPTRS